MIYNYRIEIADRACTILAQSRVNAGLSRKKMSESIGVSESTIKAWESGQGSPTFSMIVQWFHITGANPFSAMLAFFWPQYFSELSAKTSDAEFRAALNVYFEEVAGSKEIRKIHYLLFGDHGGDWSGILDMFCAHMHTSLQNRYKVAEITQISYELSLANHTLREVPDIESNRPLLTNAVYAAETASRSHKEGYTTSVQNENLKRISSEILLRSRLHANQSPRYLAKALGKTERTIHHRETNMEPSFLDVCEWFHALREPVWPYLRNALDPVEPITLSPHDRAYQEELIRHFSTCDPTELRKFCFLVFGKHGSYWKSILEMMIEHVCVPLPQRVISARSILVGYQIDNSDNALREADLILPDIENLKRCIELGTKAAKAGKTGYC